MTYPEAIQFLYGLQTFGARFGLPPTRALAARVGDPQRQLRFIHVAGTNGKGSTCAMLESIYRTAGWRVGLFTSPHLISFRERLQVNRQLISEPDLVRLVMELRANLPAESAATITLFEFVTVLALRYFAEQKCDLVIWETGLGGRLDATNIVTPLASVITNIGLDHQQWLGATLPEIAAEKAGIIKPGVPVLTAAEQPEVLAVLEQIAQQNHAPLQRVSVAPLAVADALPLLGAHQQRNAALAVAAVQLLQAQFPVDAETLRRGLGAVVWPGRLQLVKRPDGRQFLIDGAHNEAGVTALLAALRAHFPGVKPTVIFGMLADKEWRGMARQLAAVASRVMPVPVASARTVAAADLAAVCQTETTAPPVGCASLAAALEQAARDPFVVITGSLYLVGEALELLGCGPAGATSERGLNEWTAAKP